MAKEKAKAKGKVKAKAKAKAKGKTKAKTKGKTKAKTKMPTGLLRAGIESVIDALREKEKWSFRANHGKTDFYEYLKAVYRRRRWAERQAHLVAVLYDIDVRKGTIAVRIIIDASCGEPDRQQISGGTGPQRSRDKYRRQMDQRKSRWVRAIEYLAAKKVPTSEFTEFVDKNGGVQGCADKMAALEKREPG